MKLICNSLVIATRVTGIIEITSTSSNLFQRRFINFFRIYIIYITARQILQYYKCMGLNTAYNVLILYILAIGHVG